jgi:hypothetical protein
VPPGGPVAVLPPAGAAWVRLRGPAPRYTSRPRGVPVDARPPARLDEEDELLLELDELELLDPDDEELDEEEEDDEDDEDDELDEELELDEEDELDDDEEDEELLDEVPGPGPTGPLSSHPASTTPLESRSRNARRSMMCLTRRSPLRAMRRLHRAAGRRRGNRVRSGGSPRPP